MTQHMLEVQQIILEGYLTMLVQIVIIQIMELERILGLLLIYRRFTNLFLFCPTAFALKYGIVFATQRADNNLLNP
jgi:hypothetical protein